MSLVHGSALLLSIHRVFDDIGYWWGHATPKDFGLLAITVVVAAWFVTKYYLD